MAQALHDVRDATILEVWEHHRIGDLDIPRPIVFHCEPVGATATLIAEQFLVNDVELPRPSPRRCCAPSFPTRWSSPRRPARTRTAAWHDGSRPSPAWTPSPSGTISWRRAGISAARSASDIIDADFKEFDLAGHQVGIAQVEAPDVSRILARRAEFIEQLRRVRDERRLLQVILLVTDIGRRGSHVWFAGDRREMLEQALGQPLVDDGMYVDGCMSRKKQWCPRSSRPSRAPGSQWRETIECCQ